MQIKIVRPNTDFPLVWVHVPLHTNTDSNDVSKTLEKKRVSLLGRWEIDVQQGKTEGFKAPALLEDEHVKPRKGRPKR